MLSLTRFLFLWVHSTFYSWEHHVDSKGRRKKLTKIWQKNPTHSFRKLPYVLLFLHLNFLMNKIRKTFFFLFFQCFTFNLSRKTILLKCNIWNNKMWHSTGNPMIFKIMWYFDNYLVENNFNSPLLICLCHHNYSFSVYNIQHYMCCQWQIACTFPVSVCQAPKTQSGSENLVHKKPTSR